jgi:hypothetical protein
MKHTVCGNKVSERERVDLYYGEWNHTVEYICDNCVEFVSDEELEENSHAITVWEFFYLRQSLRLHDRIN